MNTRRLNAARLAACCLTLPRYASFEASAIPTEVVCSHSPFGNERANQSSAHRLTNRISPLPVVFHQVRSLPINPSWFVFLLISRKPLTVSTFVIFCSKAAVSYLGTGFASFIQAVEVVGVFALGYLTYPFPLLISQLLPCC